MDWSDRDIVLSCLKHYPASYAVTSWPEESNRNAPEIDAYAEAPGAPPLAIEVTKIESFADQRFDDRQIEELACALEPDLTAIFPHGVNILIESLVMRPGLDWKSIRGKIRHYLTGLVRCLEPGLSRHVIEGVPFPIFVSYEPEIRTPLAVGRIAPSDEAKSVALMVSTEKALRHKAPRLQEYRKVGARSVLVLESHDIALISHVHVYSVFLKARKRVDASHLDDVWFCRTANPHRLDEWYAFDGPQDLLDLVNLPNLRLGPRYDSYWEKAIAEGRI